MIMHRLAAIAAGTLLLWDEAFAYIDPGTGSLLLQWLIGMVLAGFAVLNLYWQRLKGFFSGKSGSEPPGHDVETVVDEAETD